MGRSALDGELAAVPDTRTVLVFALPGEPRLAASGALLVAGAMADVQRLVVTRARKGCRGVLLEVRVGNEPAAALYAAHGFVEISRRRGYFAAGRTLPCCGSRCHHRHRGPSVVRVRDVTYPPVVVAAKTAFRVLGIRFDIRGTEHIPTSGPAVLAFNHIGYVDFVFGGLAAQPSRRLVRFMSKRELFANRWTGPVMRSLHHIEVDRGDGLRSYREALRYLAMGEVVGIFPEATISRAMELKEFKTGATRLAAESGAPLVPAVLWGTQRIMTKDRPRDFSRGRRISITVGAPLHPTGADPLADTTGLKQAMAGLLDDTTRRYPDSPAGAWWAPAAYGGTAPTLERAARLDAEEKRAREAARTTTSTLR